jgi:hypothetical protein
LFPPPSFPKLVPTSICNLFPETPIQ